jgi:hypothetical protein
MSVRQNKPVSRPDDGPLPSGPQGGDVQTIEVESSVTIYDALASGPKLSDVRTVHFELRFLPYGDTLPNGIPHRQDG